MAGGQRWPLHEPEHVVALPPFPSDLVEPLLDFVLRQTSDHAPLPQLVGARCGYPQVDWPPPELDRPAFPLLLCRTLPLVRRTRPGSWSHSRAPHMWAHQLAPSIASRAPGRIPARCTPGGVGAEDQTGTRAMEGLQNPVAERDHVYGREAHAHLLQGAAPETAAGELCGLFRPLFLPSDAGGTGAQDGGEARPAIGCRGVSSDL